MNKLFDTDILPPRCEKCEKQPARFVANRLPGGGLTFHDFDAFPGAVVPVYAR